jgi:hypothetical protein
VASKLSISWHVSSLSTGKAPFEAERCSFEAASRIQFIAQEYDREVKWKAKSLKQMNEKDKQPMEGDIEM